MTFINFLHAHPDHAVQTAAQYLYGGEQGPTDLGEAVAQLDAAGAPGVAFQAVAEAWREWRETQRDKENCEAQK